MLSAALGMFGSMWMYLGFGFGVLIALNVLVVAVMVVAFRRAELRDEMRPEKRARLITYVREGSEATTTSTRAA
jgi:hypothetical protein